MDFLALLTKNDVMKQNELITIEDLAQFEKRLTIHIDSIAAIAHSKKPIYHRTKGAKELLSVSDNKLRTMRDNKEIPYSYIGGTYYYPEEEILNILKNNMIKK